MRHHKTGYLVTIQFIRLVLISLKTAKVRCLIFNINFGYLRGRQQPWIYVAVNRKSTCTIVYFCYYLRMRLYGPKIGWVAAVLLLNANAAFALPDCPKTDFPHNCFDKYTWDDGTKYVGDWQDATFNGQGTLTYSNGDRYVGEWRNGKKHGKGSYTYANGTKCFGEYKNDLLNGKARCTFADGDVLEGIWKNHKFTGK